MPAARRTIGTRPPAVRQGEADIGWIVPPSGRPPGFSPLALSAKDHFMEPCPPACRYGGHARPFTCSTGEKTGDFLMQCGRLRVPLARASAVVFPDPFVPAAEQDDRAFEADLRHVSMCLVVVDATRKQ